jgi:hypothetical protein
METRLLFQSVEATRKSRPCWAKGAVTFELTGLRPHADRSLIRKPLPLRHERKLNREHRLVEIRLRR